ncbi:hypothetical protein ACVSQB_32955 [Bradyrhizobium elkanii]
MPSTYSTPRERATPYGQKSLADFVATLRSKPGPRGAVINIIREMLEATDAPIAWSDLARTLARRNAGHLIMPARALWNEYRKSQPASVSPGSSTRRAGHA